MSDLGALLEGSQHGVSRTSMLSSSLINVNPRNQLLQAREILELGLQNVSFARQAVALTDGKSIADISWAKVRFLSDSNTNVDIYVYIYFIINPKAPITAAADDKFCELFPNFRKK